MNTSLALFDGPRLVRREEIIASLQLSRLCFGEPAMDDDQEIFASYVAPRRGGTYVLVHEGRPVSQIEIFHDRLSVYDATIPTGSIGGVCTHPNFRQRGLASRLFERCAEQLVKEGARLMLVSGDKGVYTRAGSVFQGNYVYFSIKGGLDYPPRPAPAGLVLRRATQADALLCSRLYQAEPVHFVRRLSDFKTAVEYSSRNTYIHAEPWMIERDGQAVAYLFVGIPYRVEASAGIRQVSEYAGSRTALSEAIPLLMSAGHVQHLSWPVAWQDAELIRSLEKNGYIGERAPLEGHTLRILDFPNLMKELRPILRARLEATLLRGLRFQQSGPLLGGRGEDRYTIQRGPDRLDLDGAAMTRLVMGTAEVDSAPIHIPGALVEVVSALFPLPSFLPGLNYH